MANGPLGAAVLEPAPYRIPWKWQHIVCLCPEDMGTKHDLDTYGPFMVCRACNKYKRFYTSRCSSCREFYLMVFYHPAWNPHLNWCFSCLIKIDAEENLVFSNVIPPMPIVKPQQPATKEEITGAIDNLFVLDLDNSVDPFNF